MSEEQKGIKVLHIDDEPDFLVLTKAFFERENADFSIDTATSAEEGFELLKSGKYDVVVADYQMPVMDGLELLKTLRASGNTIPFIMFTGKGREEVAIEALNRGANHYLQKGGDIESMYGTLMHAIKQEVETKKERQIVLESVPAMIFHVDSDSNYIYANRSFADTFGLKTEDFKGKSTKAIFPEEAETYVKSDREIVKSGMPQIGLIRELSTPKGKRWLRTDKVPVKDAEGNVTGIIGFGLDITERKRVEEALQESAERLHTVVSNAPVVLWALDRDGIFTLSEGLGLKALGLNPGEVVGQSVFDVYRDVPKILEDNRRALAGESFVSIVEVGKLVFESHYSPIRDKNGEVIGMIGVSIDITERKRAEDALRIAKEEYHDLYEKAPLGYHTVDSQGRITDMNKTELHWLGYTREELIGKKTIFDIQTQKSANRGRKLLQRLVKKGGVLDIELEFVRKDGSVMPVNLHTSVLHNSKGEFIRTRSIVIDLTERKQAEEKLAKIVDSVNIPAFAINSEHKITHWNTAVESLTGVKREEVIGSDKQWIAFYATKRPVMADLIVDELPESKIKDWYVDKYKKSSLIEGAYEAVDFFPTLGEEGKWLLFTAAPLRDSEGTIIGAIETLQDITERKRAEDELRNANKQLRDTIEFLPDATFVIDLDKKVIAWNRAIEEMTVVRKEDIIGKGDYAYAVPFYGIKRPILIDLIFLSDKEIETRYKYVKREGNTLFAEVFISPMYGGKGAYLWGTATPLIDSEGNIVGAIESIRDITERKRAEQALRESESRYRLLAENVTDVIWTMDMNLRLTYQSPSITRLRGYSVGEAMAETLEESTSPASYELAMKTLAEELAMEKTEHKDLGRSRTLELELTCKDGSTVWVEAKMTFLRDPDGQPVGILGVSRDITERKRAEDALQKSEEEYRSLVESTEDSVYLVDRDFRYLFINEKHLSRIGMPKDQVLGKTYGELHSEDETAEFAGIVEEVFETDKSVWHEHRSCRDNRYILRTLSPVKDSEGMTTAVTVVSKDITERKKTEEVLRESEEKYRELAELLPEVVFEANLGGDITYANKVAFDSFGYTQSDFDKGVNALQMLIPEDRDRGKENIQRVLSGGKIGSREYTAQRKDKTTFPVIINSNPIIRENKPVGLRGVITDITERKHAEEEREKLLKELEAKNRELGRFTYTVSHDLRSPLITIQGFTDMVQTDLERDEVEKAKDNLTFIDKAATKMDQLLSDTLQLSRIGRMVNPPEDVPFGEIVEDALEQTAEQIKSSEVEVSVADDFPTVHVDRMRIVEVLVNLITNSINYRSEQPSPKIEIGYRIDNGERVFFVRDNGIGIDPSQHEKVFDLFYQVDTNGGGTGAGLAIVKRIIEVHNGRIWIESEKSKGCTVCFTLPVQ